MTLREFLIRYHPGNITDQGWVKTLLSTSTQRCARKNVPEGPSSIRKVVKYPMLEGHSVLTSLSTLGRELGSQENQLSCQSQPVYRQ